MPRHTFLDSILNRPSQNYAATPKGTLEQRWNAPTDLPNAPTSSAHTSLLGGSMFRRKDRKSGSGTLSNLGSEAGASTSTLGIRSRFGRKKRTPSSFLGDVSETTGNGSIYTPSVSQQQYRNVHQYPAPPSSVADSQATASRRKNRWWEGGSLTFGRRSRAPSIAGDSIFSEPEPAAGQIPWNSHGLAGIGAGAVPRRVARSDYGTSPLRRQADIVPPLPSSPLTTRRSAAGSVTSSATSPIGRLQSDVAPLGVSTLNPSLSKRSSRSKMSSPQHYGPDIARSMSASNLNRSKSPTPSQTRVPGSLASSPHVRRLSQEAKRAPATDGSDWKDFMKSMAGTDIARAWQGTRNAPDMAQAATGARSSVNLDLRKSHYERVQKELQQDAQFEQTVRDPGIVHQDLLARAASQVVGSVPPGAAEGQAEYFANLQPGAVIPPQDGRSIEQPRQHEARSILSLAHGSPIRDERQRDLSATESNSTLSESARGDDEESSDGDERESRDEYSAQHMQNLLDVVNEEDEDISSQGTASRRQSLKPTTTDDDEDLSAAVAPRFKAFEAALNKSRNSVHSNHGGISPFEGTSTRSPSLRTKSISDARAAEDEEPPRANEGPAASDKSPSIVATTDPKAQLSTIPRSEDGSEDYHDAMGSPWERLNPLDARNAVEKADVIDEDAMEVMQEDDKASQHSGQTGRATVTFQNVDDKADARSIRSAASRASRPGTLQRRLSDVSLGTSFGISNIMQIGRSRPSSFAASSRRIKLADGDEDSAGSRSDDDDDEDLKARIQAEQERLRNMKVGEDFFGGSLSAILDKFDSANWDEGVSATVGQLGLDVGTQGAKRNSISAQDVLNMNAQERLMEVRRQRHDGGTPSKRRMDLSETRTMESCAAPSFAAMWLLNQAAGEADEKQGDLHENKGDTTLLAKSGNGLESSEASASNAKRHVRNASAASSENATVTTSHSPSAATRVRNLFGMSSSSSMNNGTPERKMSVMDRPRNRGPKPREMGGRSIARGKLAADVKEEAKDTRNILSDVWIPQTLSQMREAQAAAATSSPERATPSELGSALATSPPVSPISKLPPSKEKPAPVKSAIKSAMKPSMTLADTLFSLPNDSTRKRKTSMPNLKSKAKGNGTKDAVPDVPKVPSQLANKAVTTHAENVARRRSHDMSRSEQKDLHTPTAVRPAMPALRAPDEVVTASASAPSHHDVEKSVTDPTSAFESLRHDEDPSPLSSSRSPPPASELWSGESVVSTGPATPGVSEVFDRRTMNPLQRLPFVPAQVAGINDEARSTPSPRDKKLPLPPVPSFPDDLNAVHIEEDVTPLAVHRTEPLYVEQNGKTPRAEREDPEFGMNVIPPTPQAENKNPMVSTSSHQTSETLDEAEADDAQAPATFDTVQRTHSADSKDRMHSSNSLTRKSSTKRRSPNNTSAAQEYAGNGLHLPPGLVATTVASSSLRRRPQSFVEEPADQHADTMAKSSRKTAKARSKSMKERNTRRHDRDEDDARRAREIPASQDMQHSLSAKLASLTPPVPGKSDGSSSGRGSDVGNSRGSSQSHSPAVSVSEHSSALSSSAMSSSAASDSSSRGGNALKHTTNGQQAPPRKIRTVTAGPNGHARTSLMSAISEWENSPVDIDRSQTDSPMQHAVSRSPSGYASPMPYAQHMMNAAVAGPSGYRSPLYTGASSVTRSQSSVFSGSSPSLIRNAPVGAPTDRLLQPSSNAQPGADRRLSVPASDFAPWGTSYTGGEESEGGHSQYSTASLPAVPQSSYRARDPHKASNTIDDRLYAKTTMATVAVTSGAFRHKSVKGRKSSVDLRQNHDDAGSINGRRSSMDMRAEGMLVDELQRTTMSLTSHTAPPRKLTSTQVLVQVIACAIDEMDKLLLRERVQNHTAYGFVPGRSFCGRIMETGWEVKRMRMGDIVFGLQSSRKCGALAEFMTIEQDLVAKAPQDCLTMEQIAALPSVGVMAHQLMVSHCSQLKRGSRILILNAHDGVGLLAMQECATLGLIIVAHCPNQVSDGVAICEANGAHEVIVGEPLWALNTLHESSLDLIVDTVGGRRVYDASRRILAFGGQFCTFFGDLHSSGANPNLRSHLRSLRRSFFKKDTKQIGYEWVGTDTAEDCREALEAVRRAAEDGLICPRLKSVLAFAEGPRAFEDTLRGVEEEPGATVVRIS